MYILTSDNMKKAENNANGNGLSFREMMESAGRGCAEKIKAKDTKKKVTILIGKGKNGGDGLVIARYLSSFGFKHITVVLVHGDIGDSLCFEMFAALTKYPVDIQDYTENPQGVLKHIETSDIIIDCIYGIGFKGDLKGSDTEIVTAANNNNCIKYAIDIPSGLSASGEYHGQLYFHTDQTLSMISYKPVHILMPTAAFCGKTSVINIGIEQSAIESFAEKYTAMTPDEVRQGIKPRPYDSNKGDYGKILTLSGSRNMTGCVYFINQAAVEMGAGLVVASFPECIYDTVTQKLNEPIFLPLPQSDGFISSDAKGSLEEQLNTFSVIAAGCGIGVNKNTKKIIKMIIKKSSCPVVLDADGINCIADSKDILKTSQADIVLTPHPGEMARLCEKSIDEIQSDRINIASDFAREYNATLVLKGSNTVIADKDGRITVNATGNPGMARGGSGDVLTGIIAGLIPQTADVFSASCAGVYIHGATGDYIAKQNCLLACTPTRLTENLHHCLAYLMDK